MTTRNNSSSVHAASPGNGPASVCAPRAPQAAGIYTAHVSAYDTTIIAAETLFAGAFGLTVGEICGRNLCDLLLSRSPVGLLQRFTDLCEGRTNGFTEKVAGRNSAGRPFCASLVAKILADPAGPAGFTTLLSPAERPEPVGEREEVKLSELDARLVERVATGASTRQLANSLYMSRQGVEYRVGRLLREFDAPNRPALVARAHSLGMFAPGQWPPRVLPHFIA